MTLLEVEQGVCSILLAAQCEAPPTIQSLWPRLSLWAGSCAQSYCRNRKILEFLLQLSSCRSDQSSLPPLRISIRTLLILCRRQKRSSFPCSLLNQRLAQRQHQPCSGCGHFSLLVPYFHVRVGPPFCGSLSVVQSMLWSSVSCFI